MALATHFLTMDICFPGDRRQTDSFSAPLDFPVPREGEYIFVPETSHRHDDGKQFTVPAARYRVTRVVHCWVYQDRELWDRDGTSNTSIRLYVEEVDTIDPIGSKDSGG